MSVQNVAFQNEHVREDFHALCPGAYTQEGYTTGLLPGRCLPIGKDRIRTKQLRDLYMACTLPVAVVSVIKRVTVYSRPSS